MGMGRPACAAAMLAGALVTRAWAQAPRSQATLLSPPAKTSTPEGLDDRWIVAGQSTLVDQTNAGFTSPFQGPQSLRPGVNSRETLDVTLFAGWRPRPGTELWISPEVDQGFGLSNTNGVAGFLSGEAYKVGAASPYIRLQRLFVRQTFDLGGAPDPQEAGLTGFAAAPSAERLVLTAGKMSVGDVFDTNAYAHDPRGDFFNWGLIDTGTFDYAADAWGYTYGATGEWYTGAWTLRAGGFSLSKKPNGEALNSNFAEYQAIGEVERRYRLLGQDGKLKLTAFESRGRMGDFADALRLAAREGGAPATADVRRYRGRAGASLNIEQPLGPDLGVFLRAGYADGHQETYEFTDISRTGAGGASLKGGRWGRPDDTAGVAVEVNDASEALRKYLAAGGLGLLIGDGRLPHYGTERIVESYYGLALRRGVALSLDYQYVENPAYDRDRGPASVFGLRLHLQGAASGR